jgi:dTDP-4-amino-4,6-dideoxygalactose transaminase
MFPGAMRMEGAEERAAVKAVRELMRARRLSAHTTARHDSLRTSQVGAFEHAFAKRIGVAHAIAVNSGTSALVAGLAALGIGPGDEVIVPAYTWFSTASSVLAVGAVPVFAEIDDSLTLDPGDVAARISPHTRAIVPVHMRGAPARMDALMELARGRDLRVLEDVAQATGASFRGAALGSIGDAGAFSFEMSKILTAGEGGMLTAGDTDVGRRAAMYSDAAAGPHLWISAQEWLPGLNLRMSELQAAVLLVQLGRLDGLLADMRERKAALESAVRGPLQERGVSLRTIHDPDGEAGVALVFFLPDAGKVADVVDALANENVPASRLYNELAGHPHELLDLHALPGWTPILERRSWSAQGGPWRGHPRDVRYSPDDCPATLDLLRRAVHVDVSPDLTPQQVEQIAGAIVDVVGRRIG